MDRDQWYSLFRDVRTPVLGSPNLFPREERAAIALQIALGERKEKWREEITKLFPSRE